MNDKSKFLIIIVIVLAAAFLLGSVSKYNKCMSSFIDDELQVLAAVTENLSYCSSLEEGNIETSTCTDPSISKVKCVDQVYFFKAIKERSTELCMNISFPCMKDMCINTVQKTCDNITVDIEDIYYCKAWTEYNQTYCNFLEANRTRGDRGCEGSSHMYQGLYEKDDSFCRNIDDKGIKMFCNSLTKNSISPVFSYRAKRCISELFIN